MVALLSPEIMKSTFIQFVAAALLVGSAGAAERRFVYSYETTTAPVGMWEYEQWVTWKSYDDRDRFDFRHEFEYGLTERLQIGLYLADWRYEDFDNGDSEADYKSTGVEFIYQLTDPNKSAFGSALYGEMLVGDEKFALEGKFLLQKNIGPLVAIYNLVLEAEWEGDDLGSLDEDKAVWENTFGLSYQVNPNFLVGVEALHEIEFAEWSDAGEHVFYAGPNVSFRKGNVFATVAGLFQVTDVDGEPDSQVRLLAGIHF